MSPYNYPAEIGEGFAYACWCRRRFPCAPADTFFSAWRNKWVAT